MTEELTETQRTILDYVADQVRRGGVSGKRLRAQLRVTTAEIRSLVPKYLDGYAREPGDNYALTFEGVLSSRMATEARRALLAVLRTLKAKFQDDPDFIRYDWPEVKRYGDLTIEDKELQFFDVIIRLAGLADRSSTEGNPPIWGWYTPHHIEFLVRGTKSGDLEDFTATIRAHLAQQQAAKPIPLPVATTLSEAAEAKDQVEAEVSGRPRVELRLGDLISEPTCQLIVLPCSTAGTVKKWVEALERRFSLKRPKGPLALGTLSDVQTSGSQSFVYAVSVEREDSDPTAVRRLGEALGEVAHNASYRIIGAPLLGAGKKRGGQDRLVPEIAYDALAAGFLSTAHAGAILMVLVPERDRFEHLKARGASEVALRAEQPPSPAPSASSRGEAARSQEQSGDITLDRSVRSISLTDRPAAVDALGFEPYVAALSKFLGDPETKPPLTLSVEGEWGSGKSSFLAQLRDSLRANKHRVIEFNAWRHDKDESLWAAFAEQFFKEVQPGGFLRRLWSRLRLDWRRIDKVPAYYDLFKVLLYMAVIAVAAWQIWKTAGVVANQESQWWAGAKLVVSVIASLWSAARASTAAQKVGAALGDPFKLHFAKHLDVVDYKSMRTFLSRFQIDFGRMLKTYVTGDAFSSSSMTSTDARFLEPPNSCRR